MAKRGVKRGRGGSGPKRTTGGRRPLTAADIHHLLDDVDAAMLNGDLERAHSRNVQLLQRRGQAASALSERLIDGRAKIPFVAFEQLGLLAGERAPSHLLRIASEARAPDIVRWGAHRRLGWDADDEGRARLEFLGSLRDPDLTLVAAIIEANGWWPPDAQVLQEVMAYLELLPSARRLALIREIPTRAARELCWLLRALVHLDDSAVQLFAIAELVRLRDRAATGALSRLVQTTTDKRVRAEAEAAIRRLWIGVAGADVLPIGPEGQARSEERRVGKECTSWCRSRWWP